LENLYEIIAHKQYLVCIKRSGDFCKLNILFIINTPAQAHMWIPIIHRLISKGNKVKTLARNYGSTIELLNSSGIPCLGFKPITMKYLRVFEIFVHLWKGIQLSNNFGTTLILGFGIDAALMSPILRKPSIIFTDNDPTRFQNNITSWFAGAIITPDCFRVDLGHKHVRMKGYKELAYLHPNYFKPDLSIYDELKLTRGDKYVILRFNVFDAVHDIGAKGFSSLDRAKLVKELEKYAHVFISPEGTLSKDLECYRLPISYNRIHHALYYAQLLVTDTQTMATEAAILGTPVVRSNSFVGRLEMGNFVELEQKYNLIYSYSESAQALQKSLELIKQPDLKAQWAKKRKKLIDDKADITQFIVDFIDDYPASFRKMKKKVVMHK
jgi:uncharacterized protein